MTLYVELSVPASTFTVGRFLSPDDRVRVEFAHAVPLGRGEQCFWLVGDDRAAVLARFGDAGLETTVVEELPDRTLVRAGYYDIPRRSSLSDLSASSDQAISERLRRGSAALIDATILADTQDHR